MASIDTVDCDGAWGGGPDVAVQHVAGSMVCPVQPAQLVPAVPTHPGPAGRGGSAPRSWLSHSRFGPPSSSLPLLFSYCFLFSISMPMMQAAGSSCTFQVSYFGITTEDVHTAQYYGSGKSDGWHTLQDTRLCWPRQSQNTYLCTDATCPDLHKLCFLLAGFRSPTMATASMHAVYD